MNLVSPGTEEKPVKLLRWDRIAGSTAATAVLAVALLLLSTNRTCGCDGGKQQRVRGDFNILSNWLRIYQIDLGQLPTQEQGLEALIRRPADLPEGAHWKPMGEALMRDAWGNSYHYVRDDSLPYGFGLYSAGPNGRTHGLGMDEDDLHTWDPK